MNHRALALCSLVVAFAACKKEPARGPVLEVAEKKSRPEPSVIVPGSATVELERMADAGLRFTIHRKEPINVPLCSSDFSFAQHTDAGWTAVPTDYFIPKSCSRYVESGPPPTDEELKSYCRCEARGHVRPATTSVTWSGRMVVDNRAVEAPRPGRYKLVVPDGELEFDLP